MSDTYKTIARARHISAALITDLDWTKSAVIAEIGITFALYNDIMELDSAAVKIYNPSIEKLKAFIAKHEAVLDKPYSSPPGVHRSSSADPFPITPKPKKSPYKEPESTSGGDPLSELDRLVAKFKARGYKLETRIIKISETV